MSRVSRRDANRLPFSIGELSISNGEDRLYRDFKPKRVHISTAPRASPVIEAPRDFQAEVDSVESDTMAGKVSILLKARQKLVRLTVENLGWNVIRLKDMKLKRWDMAWVDCTVEELPEYLRCVQPHHRVNHLPGIWHLSRKKMLAQKMNRMLERFPEEYAIFPKAYILPEQYVKMMDDYSASTYEGGKPTKTYIVKPDARCQGRGIYLTRYLPSIKSNESVVVQRYLTRPLLLNGVKCDLRLYLLITSVSPLRIYWFDDGLVRLATEKYVAPSQKNLHKSFVHLTNYSINKHNEKFEAPQNKEDTIGASKWTFKGLLKELEKQGRDVDRLKADISDVLIKLVISSLPELQHSYKVHFPRDMDGSMAFQVLGIDVFLNDQLKPYIIEVNRNMSLKCDSSLDTAVKGRLLKELFAIVRPPPSRKDARMLREQQRKQRSFAHETFAERRIREETQAKLTQKRADYELRKAISSGWKRIYPLPPGNEDIVAKYHLFAQHAQSAFQDQTSTRRPVSQR